MTDWTATLIIVGVGAYAVRRKLRATPNEPPQVQDIAKAGELFGTASDWLRAGDVEAARAVLDLIGADGWQFAYNEVVLTSRSLRIQAMAGRMSTGALLATPMGVPPSADRMAQVEALAAIANEIRRRTRQY